MTDFEWKINKSIALVGIMGAGKSHLGRLLSKKLHMPFIDTDQEIVGAAGITIQDIFEQYGYEELQALEERVLKRVVKTPHQIISTGDGVFVSEQNRTILKKHAVTIWLRADLSLILNRTTRREHRPLLNIGDPKDILEDLIHERYPIYNQADIIVDSEDVSPGKMIHKILQALEDYQAKNSS